MLAQLIRDRAEVRRWELGRCLHKLERREDLWGGVPLRTDVRHPTMP